MSDVKEWVSRLVVSQVMDHPVVTAAAPTTFIVAMTNHFSPFFHVVDSLFNMAIAVAGGAATVLVLLTQIYKWKLARRKLQEFEVAQRKMRELQDVVHKMVEGAIPGGRRATDEEARLFVELNKEDEDD